MTDPAVLQPRGLGGPAGLAGRVALPTASARRGEAEEPAPDAASPDARSDPGEAPAPITGSVARGSAPPPRPRPLGAWALVVSMFALSLSWFVGWALPLAVAGVVLAIVALTRRGVKRELAWWALGLSLGAVGCSLFWIWWATQAVSETPGVL
ncbi:hypothetical protein [Microbacterium album]|uniref:DUF4190 domain-containing protein n=1 Tax=Microbacterium album TaxID=2053191 RepID=A0A917MLW9_9MICO|nr:hypothetical protein [Microbacterium album]GGH40811.1 hypothetical protein GCM10010921_13000 [Microbacterium album]